MFFVCYSGSNIQIITMLKSSKERVAAHRQRKKAGIEIPLCKCDRPLKGKLSQRRGLCQRCFLDSPDGKHRAWLRVNKNRDREVLQELLNEWQGWKVGNKAIAPDGSQGIVQAIALYVDGSVTAAVQFDDDLEPFLISTLKPLISY